MQPTNVQFEGQTTPSRNSPLQMPQVMKSFCVTAFVPNVSCGSVTDWKTSRGVLGDIEGVVGIHCSEVQGSREGEEDDMVRSAECVEVIDGFGSLIQIQHTCNHHGMSERMREHTESSMQRST